MVVKYSEHSPVKKSIPFYQGYKNSISPPLSLGISPIIVTSRVIFAHKVVKKSCEVKVSGKYTNTLACCTGGILLTPICWFVKLNGQVGVLTSLNLTC